MNTLKKDALLILAKYPSGVKSLELIIKLGVTVREGYAVIRRLITEGSCVKCQGKIYHADFVGDKGLKINGYRVLRTELGIPIEEIANLCGVSIFSICRLEQGNRLTPRIMKKINNAILGE